MSTPEGPDPERLFALFTELVRIDSESGGERRVSDYIKGLCTELGFAVREDGAGRQTGGECGNLFVGVPGSGFQELEPIILNAHMDTVAPGVGIIPVDAGDRFVSRSDTVLGADCKVGIAAILAAAEAVSESGLPHRALQLVFTVQEEPGLLGVRHMDLSLIRGRWGVVLDGSGPIGGIVVEAPGQDQVKFTVRGRSAHSGIEPEKGVNAIACAADAISSIKIGRHDGATTSNIGLFSGGTAVNIVPDTAVVEGEIRSLESSRLEQERDAMIGAFKSAARRHGCKIGIEVDRTFEQFHLPSDSHPVRYLSAALVECGFNPSLARSGGGSDANILNHAGFEMAVMQIGLANAHSKDEYILKEDLVAAARVVNKLPFIVLDEETRVGGS